MTELVLGGIYIFKSPFIKEASTIRIIGIDDIQVFYDVVLYDNTWRISGTWKKKHSFLRVRASVLAEQVSLLEVSPLIADEMKFFAPELPMRIGCIKNLSWLDLYDLDYNAFSTIIKENSNIGTYSQRLMVNGIVLIPFGNKGGAGKHTVLMDSNSKDIGCIDLLWNACQIRKTINTQESDGIGIHRTGFSKGLPSYYIDSYYDKAGIMKLSGM